LVVGRRSGKPASESIRPLVEVLVTTKAAMGNPTDVGVDVLQVLVQEIRIVEGE
jgi:hypothetical protein